LLSVQWRRRRGWRRRWRGRGWWWHRRRRGRRGRGRRRRMRWCGRGTRRGRRGRGRGWRCRRRRRGPLGGVEVERGVCGHGDAVCVLVDVREVARACPSVVVEGDAWELRREDGRVEGLRVAAGGLALVHCDGREQLVVFVCDVVVLVLNVCATRGRRRRWRGRWVFVKKRMARGRADVLCRRAAPASRARVACTCGASPRATAVDAKRGAVGDARGACMVCLGATVDERNLLESWVAVFGK
jgi:hypothetical protein